MNSKRKEAFVRLFHRRNWNKTGEKGCDKEKNRNFSSKSFYVIEY